MVQALNRAFDIVRHVAASDDGIRLHDLAKLCGLKKTTVFNLAETLVAEGMLSKDGAARYRLGGLVTELYLGGLGNRNLHRTAAILLALHRLYPAASIVYTELGETDIFGRLNLPAGQPEKVEYTDGMTLNPYVTVCGVLYFAFTPDERLNGLRMRNPFEYKGMEVWGSEMAFRERVEAARRCGWAETPTLVGPDTFKVGVPVRDGNGNLKATITFSVVRNGLPPDERILTAIFESAERIGRL